MPNVPTFLLVIPAFRESHRLPGFLADLLPAVAGSDLDIRVRVVDDGSGRHEQTFLQEHIKSLQPDYDFLEDPVLNPHHHGKGYAVHTGWRHEPVTAGCLAFVDADGSIAPADVIRLMHVAAASADPQLVLISSRKPSPDTVVRRRLLRRLLNRLFADIVNILFRLSLYDPQCGFKIISTDYFNSIEGMLQEHGFIFDVELLAHAKADGIPIREECINWSHMHHNRIHLVKDGIIMLIDVTRLRLRMARTRGS
jgi:dolichyl-phosphate beta-glucosyltransferase